MSEQHALVAKVPTALQQRLGWKPVKRTAYREMGDFRSLFDVYCFATGKRYDRVDNSRTEVDFVCRACKRGCCSLRQHRTSAASWWSVKLVVACDCGEPPALLKDVESNDLTALVGRYVPQKSDWRLLACACFPRGYVRSRPSSRRWRICCREEQCAGELDVQLQYVGGGRKYDAFTVLAASNCSKQCKEIGGQRSVIPVRALEEDGEACPLCCQDRLDEWVKFPCGQQTCRGCFEKLVQSCPAEISKGANLAVFEPSRNPSHHHSCPFCKAPYSSQTKVQHRVRTDEIASREVRVCDLIPTPYAYQSFDANAPAHIATEAEYCAMEPRYEAYLRRVEAQRLQESRLEAQRGFIRLDELLSLLDATTWRDFERLQTLQQSGRFRRHRHMVLNFIDAIEFLHERALDGGFLQRVADEHDDERRYNLMQNAYEIGWDGPDDINPQLVLNLLQRNQLVEVIDLVSDSESDNGEDEED